MNGDSKKILIVDDEPEIRSLVKETLMVDEFRILEAENGEAALRMIRDESPDIVLLDVMMPGNYDGLEVCRRIKKDHLMQRTPVIFLTAVSLPQLQADQSQAEAIFIKPFSPMQLVDRIYDVLAANRI